METTLYDGKDHPVAYIADDGENSIYLWRAPRKTPYFPEVTAVSY